MVSVGEAGPFEHRAEAVLERYEQARVRLLRTGHDGAVTDVADGWYLGVQTFPELHAQ